MYDFAKSNMEYIYRELDADGDGWPEGLGNVERPGHGRGEARQHRPHTMRGLRDLEDLAKSKGDAATASGRATRRADLEARASRARGGCAAIPQHADSLGDPGNEQIQQRHWIGVDADGGRDRARRPRRARPDDAASTATPALDLRETACYGDDFGLFHTGDAGLRRRRVRRARAEQQTFTLNTAIMAVGEGNYGRLGPDQQQRFTTANRRLQLPDSDEQPGAMPEIAPSPD